MKTTTRTFVMLILGAGLTGVEAPDESGKSKTEDMAYVEGGTFQMGDVFGEQVRFATPVHEVTLSSFYLGKYEVTVEEFSTFVKDTGYVTSAERGDNHTGKSRKVPAPRTPADYKARLASG